jgi:hypothetical protein
MKVASGLIALLFSVTPLVAQTKERADALAAAVEYAITDSRFGAASHSAILLDTLRADVAPHEAAQLARRLGLRPGTSEEQCRRFRLDEAGPWGSYVRMGFPVGLEVHGVDAIVTASFSEFNSDSAYVWVSIVSGAGQHFNGPGSYVLRRDSTRWQVEPHLASSGGSCDPRLFTVPLALATQTMLDSLKGAGPICMDPTGFPLLELDSMAAVLGAEIHGKWVPDIDGKTPEPYRNPCAKAERQWGSIVRFLHVEWETDDLIRVTAEGRTPGDEANRRLRYILRKERGQWNVVSEEEVSRPPQG